MFSLNDRISIRQLQVLLILDVFGTGVMILPRRVAEFAGQDGWLCVVIATVFMLAASFIMLTVAGMFPQKSFLEYTSLILSKPIGILVSITFVIKIIFNAALELRFFAEIIRQTLLETTPSWVICLTMLALGAYAAARGYETRARLAELLIFIVFIPLALVFLLSIGGIDLSNLQPVLVSSSPNEIIQGGYFAAFAFNGVEFCLLAFPYLSRKNAPALARKRILHVIFLIGAFMTVLTAMTIARFGVSEIQYQMWPVLEMMDTVNIPGAFVERQGALVMSFWIVSVFAILNAGLFFSSLLLQDICNRGRHFMYILIVIPIIYGLTFIPQNIAQAYEYLFLLNSTFGLAFFFIIPPVLLIVAKLRGLDRKQVKNIEA